MALPKVIAFLVGRKTVTAGIAQASAGAADADKLIATNASGRLDSSFLVGIQVKGDTGEKGAKGDKGDTGAAGAAGATWYSGDVAPDNNQGSNGDYYLDTATSRIYKKSAGAWALAISIAGTQGPQGPQGTAGTAGAQGEKGEKGDTGAAGAQGPQGIQGAQGIQGPQGIQGTKGDTGAKGDTGPRGLQGLQGDTGAQGNQGERGPEGIATIGPKGDKGDPGSGGEKLVAAAFAQIDALATDCTGDEIVTRLNLILTTLKGL